MKITPYTIYCDASGQPNDGEVLFVSGYGSSASKWSRFETQWNALLKKYRITPPFHMNEFAPGVGQYQSWKQDVDARKQFFTDAINVVKVNTNKSFSVGVPINDFKRMQTEYELPDGIGQDTPYSFCSIMIYHQVKAWLLRHDGARDPIEIVFEHGDKDQGHLVKRIKQLYPKLDPPIFKRKSEICDKGTFPKRTEMALQTVGSR